MKNILIATVTAAVVLSSGAALADSAGHNQFSLSGFNTNVNTTGATNRVVDTKGHHQFNTRGFASSGSVNFDGANRTRSSVAKEFAPWAGSN